jgi:hypothetical protein
VEEDSKREATEATGTEGTETTGTEGTETTGTEGTETTGSHRETEEQRKNREDICQAAETSFELTDPLTVEGAT